MRKLISPFILILLIIGCNRGKQTKQQQTQVKKNKKTKDKKIKSANQKKENNLLNKNSVFYNILNDILKCNGNAECIRNLRLKSAIARILPVSVKKEKADLLKAYAKAETPVQKLAVLKLLSSLSIPDSWLDIFHQWLNLATDKHVKSELYAFMARFNSPGAYKLLYKGILHEKDYFILKNILAVSLTVTGSDALFGETFKKSDPKRARLILLYYSKLPFSEYKAEILRNCVKNKIENSGQCAYELAKFSNKQSDFKIVENKLKSGKFNIYDIAAYWKYVKKPWFNLKSGKELMYEIVKNKKNTLILRTAALGEIGTYGDKTDLPELLELASEPKLADAVKRNQWRLRKRLGLPTVYRLPSLKHPVFPKSETENKKKSTQENPKEKSLKSKKTGTSVTAGIAE